MRRVVMTLAALAMAGVVADVWHSNARDTNCKTTLDYKSVSYAVYQVTDEISGKDEVGVGTERGCGDKGPWSEDVAVSRIAGVDPRTALVTPVAAHVLYVGEDVTIDELPSDIAELVAP